MGSKKELEDLKDFCPDTSEAHLRENLELLGEPDTVRVYVDMDHAGKLSNRRSHSGILFYVNNTIVKFHNKRQKTV